MLLGDGSREALLDVSEVWRRRAARNILLAGEPGAGKEVAASLIHWGRARGRFRAVSIAGSTWENMEIPLLGEGQPGRPAILKGFIEEALNGTLLVDEADKADRSVRDALLRIIEGDEFFRPNSGDRIDISGPSRPLFVFAGSGQGPRALELMERLEAAADDGAAQRRVLEEWGIVGDLSPGKLMETEYPRDFWQRMDRKIELRHPYIKSNGVDRRVFEAYVTFFLEQARSTSMTMANASPFASDRLLWLAGQAAARQIQSVWEEMVDALQNTLLPEDEKDEVPGFRIVRSAACVLFEDISARARDGELRGFKRKRIDEIARSAVEQAWGPRHPS